MKSLSNIKVLTLFNINVMDNKLSKSLATRINVCNNYITVVAPAVAVAVVQ